MKTTLLFGILFAASRLAMAQAYSPVAVTGFNADVIANGTGSATVSTNQAVDAVNFSLVASDFVNPSNLSASPALPASGLLNSITTSGLSFQLANYTGNNDMRLVGSSTGTLTFTTPQAAQEIYVLGFSGSGANNATITVTFTDATTQVFTSQTFKDWFNQTGFAVQGISRVNRVTNAIENLTTNPRMYQIPLVLNAANTSKLIQSVKVTKTTGTGVINVMAVSVKNNPPALTNDLALTSVSGLTSGCNLSVPQTVTVTVANQGSASQSAATMQMTVDGGAIVSEVYPGTIVSLATITYVFTTKVNLSAPGPHTIVVKVFSPNDQNPGNDSKTISVTNSMLTALPIALDFETNMTGLPVMNNVINLNAGIVEATAASNGSGTKGLIFDGRTDAAWVMPISGDPFLQNTSHNAAAKVCINPSGGNPNDPLWVSFDLKQLYKNANSNTNFRVMVNGTQVGPTYRPPFSGTPITWDRKYLDLSAFKNLSLVEISFESNAMETYNNGAGTANLVDNIAMQRFNPTAVTENQPVNVVQIFPNPSSAKFTIQTNFKTFQLEVTDMNGKILQKHTVSGPDFTLKIKQYAKGMYLLKLTNAESTLIRKLLID